MSVKVYQFCSKCNKYAHHAFEGVDRILLCQECCEILRSDEEMSSSDGSYESDFIDDSSQ